MSGFDIFKRDWMTVRRTRHVTRDDGVSEPVEEVVYESVPCHVSQVSPSAQAVKGGYVNADTVKIYYSPEYALRKDDIIEVTSENASGIYRCAKPYRGLADMEAEAYEL